MTLSNATEESTYPISVTFRDETGAAVTPSSATWTLTDAQAQVVNSRSAVAISPLASTVTILLTGDDLSLASPLFGNQRVLTVKWVYTSDLGAGLPANSEVRFTVDDLLNVP